MSRRVTLCTTFLNLAKKDEIMSKFFFKGTATQPKCNRKSCQLNKDQYCNCTKGEILATYIYGQRCQIVQACIGYIDGLLLIEIYTYLFKQKNCRFVVVCNFVLAFLVKLGCSKTGLVMYTVLKVARSFANLLIKVPINFVLSNLNTFGSTWHNVINFHRLGHSEIVFMGLNTYFQHISICLIKC